MKPGKAIAVACAATIVAALPMMLTGGLAVQMSEEIGFGVAALGVLIALFRGTSSATTFLWGVATDRLGATAALRIAAVVSALACAGIALTQELGWMMVWMVVGGTGIAIALPATNRLIVNAVPIERRGMGFGIKQSSLPIASVLAGLSVPLIGLTIGWRYAFWIGCVFASGVLISVGVRGPKSSTTSTPRPRGGPIERRGLILLMGCAFGLSNLASSAMPAFYVDAAVDAGTSPSLAGTVLALAGAGAIAVRFSTGVASDRIASGHLHLCAGLLTVGAIGLGLLMTERPGLMAAGVLLGMAGVWGVNGVFWYALMRAYHNVPGKATGIVATIGHAGGTLGPLIFGGVAASSSYSAAWAICGAAALTAAGTMSLAAKSLRRHPTEGESDLSRSETSI